MCDWITCDVDVRVEARTVRMKTCTNYYCKNKEEG